MQSQSLRQNYNSARAAASRGASEVKAAASRGAAELRTQYTKLRQDYDSCGSGFKPTIFWLSLLVIISSAMIIYFLSTDSIPDAVEIIGWIYSILVGVAALVFIGMLQVGGSNQHHGQHHGQQHEQQQQQQQM